MGVCFRNDRKAILLAAMCVCCIAVAETPSLPQGPRTGASSPSTEEASATTGCVLLKNGNVLYGNATQRGQFVVVKRPSGAEIQLTRTDVTCWADSIHDLYTYRVDHRPSNSVSARIADIQWCLQHDLYDVAAAELVEIYAIAPDHPEAQRLEQRLRHAAEVTGRQCNESAYCAEVSQPFAKSQADQNETEAMPAPIKAIGESTERIRDFSRYVQPLLINRCGQCHSHQSEQAWRITTPVVGQRATSRMTHENLAATLAFIDFDSPLQSDILVKSLTPHGNEPDIPEYRRRSAAKTIQVWVKSLQSVSENHDPLNGETIDTIDQENDPVVSQSELPRRDEPTLSQTMDRSQPNDRESASLKQTNQPSHPARLPEIDNPFDPEIFNRKYETYLQSAP